MKCQPIQLWMSRGPWVGGKVDLGNPRFNHLLNQWGFHRFPVDIFPEPFLEFFSTAKSRNSASQLCPCSPCISWRFQICNKRFQHLFVDLCGRALIKTWNWLFSLSIVFSIYHVSAFSHYCWHSNVVCRVSSSILGVAWHLPIALPAREEDLTKEAHVELLNQCMCMNVY